MTKAAELELEKLAKIWRQIKRSSGRIGRLVFNLGYLRKRNDKIGLYYYSGTPNFGDSLNIDIFRRMFGIEVEKHDSEHCDIVAVGSLLESFVINPHNWAAVFDKYLIPHMFVWGTGFIGSQKYDNERLSRCIDVRAVRGHLTLERLKKITSKPLENVVVADPGLLASRLFDTHNIEKKYALGIIPHYVDEGNPLLNKIQVSNSVVLDIKQSPEIFMARLAECENVLSSAMHGLIAADSLGIPNVRMIISDKIAGGDYKYNDYYSAFGIKKHDCINLNQHELSDKDLSGISANYKICPQKVVELQDALIASFPYKKIK